MKKRRIVFLMFLDVIAINLAYILALYIRFEGVLDLSYMKIYLNHIIAITSMKLVVFYLFKLYKSLWEYASIDEMIEVVGASIVANVLIGIYMYLSQAGLPKSIYAMVLILDMALVGGSRFFYRVFRRLKYGIKNESDYKRILIIGAGAAGALVLKELRNHETLHSKPVAFIDDDPKKKGKNINGIPVVGNRNNVLKVCEKYRIDEIIIAMPSAKVEDRKYFLNECKKSNCKTRILPGVYELIDGKVNVTKIRDVQIEDLLGREEVKLNLGELSNFIEGKRVLVTGGGGSIGSELCRQIARFNPKELIILDIYENNAYDIQNELIKRYEDLKLQVIIATVRDKVRIDEVLEKIRPQIIFHAAAHKHVPLMENNPGEAIKNNVFGTLNVVQAADKYNVDKFVLISTDKAVNPTNVMGATKRICEMIIQSYNYISNTDYVAVRFGNVLGSNGSVIPLFKKQIAEGGPVTVTDERIIRFFMTIPEACQLVLQAGAMATGGEIFILDMGEPVKIMDLAKDLIRLSGFQPEVDIPIKITGLRPGEKLFEEILLNEEEMTKTSHNKIYIEEPMEFDNNKLMNHIFKLENAVRSQSSMKIKDVLAEIVPTYRPFKPVSLIEEDIIFTGQKETAVTYD
ncbi:polysaccharide biosynthesis protein [Tissierella sp. MSJ-40]|uniref:Polysaccharide biosynthesis protein n=1 Tax=Tissierella simiarum TaxID=2841534 RepID=A0ABS6E1I8_9FIRM|nr:nucleoside-diphosphate sugar epimerase/dehydratase [Tissierella simiarum]MBU5436775.1 polysaccharide biosynthesis protein [Tissierella simiarum]